MILAEELDADWSSRQGRACTGRREALRQPDLSIQATGNSNSIRAFWKPLRVAGAGYARLLHRGRGAQLARLHRECRTENSKVIHDKTGRTLDYGSLIRRAAAVTPPKDPPLKDPSAFRLIGRPLKRLDTPDKVNGKAKYGIDALPPGVKFATLAASPVLGGTVVHVDDRRARAVPGCARSWCWTTWWRSSAITCGRPSAGLRRSTSPGTTGRTPRCPPT
jgi:isoquinoline 1-oxidoreductase beta subunit